VRRARQVVDFLSPVHSLVLTPRICYYYYPSRPSRWATEHYESYDLLDVLLTDAEKSLEAFYRACYDAGQTDCPLVRQEDHSWRDIQARTDGFLESVYHAPLVAWEALRPGLVTSGYIRREWQDTSRVHRPPLQRYCC
jgi:hypothetical protein